MSSTVVSEPAIPKAPATDGLRFVAVRANLLPDEIVSARQVEVVRRQVLAGVAVVVALLIAWFGLSWWQTTSANGDLEDAQRQARALQNQQSEFAPLVNAQNRVSTIHQQLQALMTGDLSWTAMLETLRGQAPAGVRLTSVSGSVTSTVAGAGSVAAAGAPLTSGALNQSGKQSVGQLTINGAAGTKSEVAAYADKLAQVKGLTAPLITAVTTNGGSVTFTVTVLITTDALGGRYHVTVPATAPTGGK